MSKSLALGTISIFMFIAAGGIASGGQYFFNLLPEFGYMVCTQDKVSIYHDTTLERNTAVCGDVTNVGGPVKTVPPIAYLFEKEIFDGFQTKKSTDELFQKFTEELKKIKTDLRAELKEELLRELQPRPGKQSQEKPHRQSTAGGSRK